MLAAAGQAPLGLWPLALTGFGLVLWRVAAAATPREAFLRGWRTGAGYFAASLSWIVQPFFVEPEIYGWMAPFALVGMAGGLGLFWAAAGWLARRLRGGPVGLALVLTAAELARGHVLTGFPWALPGHLWLSTPLAQVGSLTGAYGMTAMTLLSLAAPLAAGRRGLIVPALVLAVAGGWSWHRLSLPDPAARPAFVRIVQPDIPQSLKWDRATAQANLDTLLRLTALPGAPDLTIWPETAVPYLIAPGEAVPAAISAAAGGRAIVVGYQRDAGAQAWNSLALIGPGGTIGPNYDKNHLVPFGEYIPAGDLVWRWTGLGAFASQAGAGYTAGVGRQAMDLGPALGRAAPLICYESIFPEEVATAPRADWILLVTNDAWFGTLTGPYQHFDLARLRAIEQGLPVLRAANTGISAVIDARGRIAPAADGRPARLAIGVQGVIDAGLPGALAAPPYARTGDLPLAVLLLAGLGGLVLPGRRRRSA